MQIIPYYHKLAFYPSYFELICIAYLLNIFFYPLIYFQVSQYINDGQFYNRMNNN